MIEAEVALLHKIQWTKTAHNGKKMTRSCIIAKAVEPVLYPIQASPDNIQKA